MYAGVGIRGSPLLKKQKTCTDAVGGAGLFRNRASAVVPQPASEIADDEFDPVSDEVKRWAAMEQSVIDEYIDKDGLVNEFALVHKHRTSFPLHYALSRQVSSHLCHEANTEQLFSQAGS